MRHSYFIATALTLAACGGKSPYYPEIIPPEGPEASPPPIFTYHFPDASTSEEASDMDVVAVEMSDASTQTDVGVQEEASSTDDASDAEVAQDAASSEDAGQGSLCAPGTELCVSNCFITICCQTPQFRCVHDEHYIWGAACVPVEDHPTPPETGCHQ
jgi:hypothetical protein